MNDSDAKSLAVNLLSSLIIILATRFVSGYFPGASKELVDLLGVIIPFIGVLVYLARKRLRQIRVNETLLRLAIITLLQMISFGLFTHFFNTLSAMLLLRFAVFIGFELGAIKSFQAIVAFTLSGGNPNNTARARIDFGMGLSLLIISAIAYGALEMYVLFAR